MQMAKMQLSEEEFKQHQKMKRLEAEAQEEVRQTLARQREAKMKAMRAAEPQKPKEITVVAGDGKSVKIQLGGDQSGGLRRDLDGGHDEDGGRRTQNVPVRFPGRCRRKLSERTENLSARAESMQAKSFIIRC